MKLQIDTSAKTIKVEGSVKLSELVETLDKLLPKVWKEFTLEANTTIVNWSSPIYIERTWPNYPAPMWITYSDSMEVRPANPQLNQGTFNVVC